MPARKADSVATAYLGLLADRGVEYLFGNAGTDFAPIIEAYAEAEQKGTRVPSPSSPPTRTLPSPWRMATRWSRGRFPP